MNTAEHGWKEIGERERAVRLSLEGDTSPAVAISYGAPRFGTSWRRLTCGTDLAGRWWQEILSHKLPAPIFLPSRNADKQRNSSNRSEPNEFSAI